MKRRGQQLHRGHRHILYAACLTLLISGAAWAWIQHLDLAGQADEQLVRLKQPLIAIHGISAMAFVLLLGTLLPGHVRRAWQARKNRRNGVFFLASVSLLTLSGYALYYLGDEAWRQTTSRFHLWLGLAAPVLLMGHIIFGRRATTARRPIHKNPHSHRPLD